MSDYRPQRGDVVLVKAMVTRVVPGADGDAPLVAARTASDRKVSFTPADVEKVVACEVRVGSQVKWWEDARWQFGEVMAIEEAETESERPARNNLWIRSPGTWVRRTMRVEDVQRT